jgi:hypothetical protein
MRGVPNLQRVAKEILWGKELYEIFVLAPK